MSFFRLIVTKIPSSLYGKALTLGTMTATEVGESVAADDLGDSGGHENGRKCVRRWPQRFSGGSMVLFLLHGWAVGGAKTAWNALSAARLGSSTGGRGTVNLRGSV